MKANGTILYEGPSMLDGAPIAVVATGLASRSSNVKTGAMVQTWILRTDVEPHTALREGSDVSVCGDCPHRSPASGGAGGCYVTVFQAPLGVFRAYHRGIYARGVDVIPTGRMLRIGSYGDPGAVPIEVWRAYVAKASGHTGYTHQWRRAPELRSLCMASVDSLAEAYEAQSQGWRTFRVAPKGNEFRLRGEARCPASHEAGKRVTCETCPIGCSGGVGLNVVIQAHGAKAKRVA